MGCKVITLQINMTAINVVGLVINGQIPGATLAAVQQTMEQAKEIIAKEVAQDINLPFQEIQPSVRTNAAKRPTVALMRGNLFLSNRPVPLRKFSPVQTRYGVQVRVYRSGSAKFYRSAFGPDVPRLGRGVFRREGRKRLPIERLPGVKLGDDRIALAAMERAEPEIKQLLQRNVKFHIDQALAAARLGRAVYGRVQVEMQDEVDGQRMVNF